MNYTFGDKIKSLRSYYKITQKELASGVCTQALISQIENGETYPSAPILKKLSDRLGVELNYFFEENEKFQSTYVDDVVRYIDKEIKSTNYANIMDMVRLEKKNPLFKSPALQSYLYWREGICTFHLYQNEVCAIELFEKARKLLPTTEKNMDERELNILLSKAIIYAQVKKNDIANDIYQTLIKAIAKTPSIIDKKLIIRIYYNASLNMFSLSNSVETIQLTQKAITFCINEGYLYLLAHLYHIQAIATYEEFPSRKNEYLYLLNKSFFLHELEGNIDSLNNVQNTIDEIT